MATRRLSRTEKQQVTRSAILESAATLFAHNGVEGTSLQEIADHAGLTQGAIYSNFKSKSELWWAICEQISGTLEFDDLFTGERSLKDELRDAGAAGARLLRDASRTDLLLSEEFNLFLMRHPKAKARFLKESRDTDREIGKKFEAVARKRDARLPMSGERLALLMQVVANGLIQLYMLDPDRIDEAFCADAFALCAGCDGEN
jgi:AcrR family transcriptional regulator